MSKEAQRGLTAIRGLFAKAAMGGGGPPTDDDDLEEALEDDFEELDGAAAADAGGVGPTAPVEATGDEYDEDEEEEPMPDEASMAMVGKAADLDADDDGQEVDAGPILADIAKAWQDTLAEIRAVKEQNALIAKGLMGLVDEQETVAKSVAGVQREVNESARLPKSGRGRPARRPAPEPLDAQAIVAKAVTDTEHFSSRDVAKLDSMLSRGDIAGVQREFDPAQIQALGLSVKN